MNILSNILSGFGGSSSEKMDKWRIGFEDVKQVIFDGGIELRKCVLIHTLPDNKQTCLIRGTFDVKMETDCINQYLDEDELDCIIIIYGINHSDISVELKQKQLFDLGFTRVYIYLGGLFEWLLLQEVYGAEEFPVDLEANFKKPDVLMYKPVFKKIHAV
jgi:hypothetical protein